MASHVETEKSGLSTASLVLGIIGICTSFIPIINNLSFVMGILSVILGVIALMKRSSKGKVIVSIILGILAIVITVNSQKALSDTMNDAINTFNNEMDTMSGNRTEEILENDIEVSLGNFEVTKGEYLTETQLKVNVKNKTSETKSFNIQIEAVDSNGVRINTDYIYANSLRAGQSQEFKVFEYVESEKLTAMKNATFNIVEVSMY